MTKLNVEKGKQGFQETVKASPTTDANLEQVQAESTEQLRYRRISDIAGDFLPNSASTNGDLDAMLGEMARKRYAMEDAESQIERVLAAREIASYFPTVARVEFQVANEYEGTFITNVRALDADGNDIDDIEYGVDDILSDRISSSSRESLLEDCYDGSDDYAQLDIAELNQQWR